MKKQSHSFDERCYQLLRRVPKGRVTTYKEIARAMRSKAYRAVGGAMNRNPDAPRTPCHRVVNSDGRLGGYAFGIPAKIKILRREGISVRSGKIENLSSVMFRF